MASKDDNKAHIIGKIIRALHERLPAEKAALADQFTRQYYQGAAPEALLESDPDDLYGAALSFWNFSHQRQPGSPAIRVYNPNFEEDGWQSTHTVVEIITDDMPFLVASASMALNRHGLTIHRIIHPLLRVRRGSDGGLEGYTGADDPAGITEASMHFEVDRQTDPVVLATLQSELLQVLNDIRTAVEDWRPMRQRMVDIVAHLGKARVPVSAEELSETRAFLEWVADNHFTFLGFRDYDLVVQGDEVLLRSVPNSGLGIMRDDGVGRISPSFAELPPELRKLACKPPILVLSKAKARSTVHRPVHLDYVGIKRFDDAGNVAGEWRFVGLYTAAAYSTNPREIPLLRNKISRVIERAALTPSGHAANALGNILDTFSRDGLFQITEDELFDTAMGILHLQERQRLRLFVHRDVFNRFFSCLVYVPRERYNTELRLRMEQILMEALNGESCIFETQFSESVLARVLFHIRTVPGQVPDYSVPDLEARLRDAMLSWEDHLHRALLEQVGEARGNDLFHRFSQAFPASYKEDYPPRTAVQDILRLDALTPDNPLEMQLYRTLEDPDGLLRFKIFVLHDTPLSEDLPRLEKMGLTVLTEHPYELVFADGEKLWIHDFGMEEEHGIKIDVGQVREIFQEAFARIWSGEMESDRFNRLVAGAGIGWRDVVMLRAYCKYLLQAGSTYSQAYIERTLANHPFITRLLVNLFHARFDPEQQLESGRKTSTLLVGIEEALDKVSSLDEDRILRRYLRTIQATLRTNFFQSAADGKPKEYLSLKFDSPQVPDLPLPHPMFEIFVYSPRVEAVHLRGGKVARGGLRWSDRPEDFRTEVLGLVKAQMVKNSVIVPVGSKGGFVVKRPPASGGREALQAEVELCYKNFIRGLLDITDNLVNNTIVPPPRVVRHDEDDPYLVVAADKGTATFSDIANGISREYGFWLDDAFASGGSVGYDHKKMGITARGAWESVKRHFRELGLDIQERDDFTVVGIGDMGGDVFGNGMLLSRHIKLLAAFNHMHIFLDPDPDPEASYRERERLFQLPRSTWEDYDANLISAGGGVFARTAKSITLSPEARAALDIQAERLTPNELINRLLQAPVDLLWNGGIGTYVKSASETHAEVGDKANDAVRINGGKLRCRVVGEGGNLGLTQLGRIEAALNGVHVLTDAIDNSGGVNCSDHEVNIKILLGQAVAAGDMTGKQRDELFMAMTDEVAELVLKQNYLQPQAISISYSRASELLGDHIRVIRALERTGKLNRAIEFLPDSEQLAEREAQGKGLVPPELAVLLAYSKIVLFEQLLKSDVPEDPYLHNDLVIYFPKPLRESFTKQMDQHPLRRDIIATYITNSMLNRMGSIFCIKLQDETGEPAPAIARAYTAARQMFGARALWADIEALDNRVPAAVQIDMHLQTRRLLEQTSVWLLRNRRSSLDIETLVNQFAEGIDALRENLPDPLQGAEREQFQAACERLIETGVPEALARSVVSLDVLYSALDIIEVARQTQLAVGHVGGIYFSLGHRLEMNWLRESIAELPALNHWQYRAQASLMDGLYAHGRALTADVIGTTEADAAPEERLDAWLGRNKVAVDRCLGIFSDLRGSGQPDLAMLSVALQAVGNLAQGGA
jgi:glutamate dehydrogenase